jgi:hypothetical protein
MAAIGAPRSCAHNLTATTLTLDAADLAALGRVGNRG